MLSQSQSKQEMQHGIEVQERLGSQARPLALLRAAFSCALFKIPSSLKICVSPVLFLWFLPRSQNLNPYPTLRGSGKYYEVNVYFFLYAMLGMKPRALHVRQEPYYRVISPAIFIFSLIFAEST